MRAAALIPLLALGCTGGSEAETPVGTVETGTPDTGGSEAPVDCGHIATFEDGVQPSAWLHVDPGGSDDTGAGSESSPFATLGHAARRATPGTAVVIHAGTYAGGEWVEDVHGTAEAPIWIGGAAGEARPHLQGGAEALHLSRVSWLVVHDLEVSGQESNGINCDDGGDVDDPEATHHVVFRDLHLHDVGSSGNQDCLKLSGLRDYWVLDSEIHHCGGGGSGSAIDHVGCHHGFVARNHLHDLSGNAVQNKGGSTDIEIRWNRMIDSGHRAVNLGGSTGFDYFRPPLDPTAENAEARDIRVVSNLIQGSQAPVAYVGCVDCQVVGNTLVDPENWLIRILQETTSTGEYTFAACQGGVFADNLVYVDLSAMSRWVNIGPDTAPETFTFSHDLWYAHDDPSSSAPDLPVDETGGVVGTDPSFTSGFAIGTTSPAGGAGIAMEALPPGDMEGTCYASPPSIGAWEVPAGR